ncbi:MAG: hypothetical protein K0S70_698 [Microbacterium sp.]|nr:hypothetical protein [Microbacterium sp.]
MKKTVVSTVAPHGRRVHATLRGRRMPRAARLWRNLSAGATRPVVDTGGSPGFAQASCARGVSGVSSRFVGGGVPTRIDQGRSADGEEPCASIE